jgi:hypothetical protein
VKKAMKINKNSTKIFKISLFLSELALSPRLELTQQQQTHPIFMLMVHQEMTIGMV